MIARESSAPSDGNSAPPRPPFKYMVWIPGGTFLMGSNDFYPEERPIHHVAVDGFWMDEHPLTSAEFRRFVKATGYVTVAERSPNPATIPTATWRCSYPARWSSAARRARMLSIGLLSGVRRG